MFPKAVKNKYNFDGKILFTHQDGDFRSVFIRVFSSVTLELMTRKNLPERPSGETSGYSHFSIEVSSKEEVDRITDYCIKNNVPLEKVKEKYDDGFYESSIIDPDGNIIEIAFIDRAVNDKV